MDYIVIPTIREKNIHDFLKGWEELQGKCEFIIVEDNPTKTFELPVQHHYSWAEIDDALGEDSWIISRRDSAIRSYGFMVAYQLGADHIFSLDDDCLPTAGESFYEKHLDKLNHTPAWSSLIHGHRTRGIPYKNQGTLNNIVLNVGLWTGVPDYDGVQTLANGIPDDFVPPDLDYILPRSQYFPICGMNICFKRELAPLGYVPLMGQHSPFGRFDDIWYGIIAKKICDHLGLLISAGHPFIHHTRASDAFNNLVKEAPGIRLNETFWQVIDGIQLKETTPLGCMREVGAALIEMEDYYKTLGHAITAWCRYF